MLLYLFVVWSFDIQGQGSQTIHSLLNIDCGRKASDGNTSTAEIVSSERLTGQALTELKTLFSNVCFLFIDELSTVNATMLALIDDRCRQGTGIDKPFGGVVRAKFQNKNISL